MCHSKTWDLKVIADVYWVWGHQVSKTPPSGMSMGHGSFMIYGKKSFIYPIRMEMGFGIMWKVDDDTYEAHQNERLVRTIANDANQIPTQEQANEDKSQDSDSKSQDPEPADSSLENEPNPPKPHNDTAPKDSQMVFDHDEEGQGLVVNTFVPKAKTVIGKVGGKGGKKLSKQQQQKVDADKKKADEETERRLEMERQGGKKVSKRQKNKLDKAKKMSDKYGEEDTKIRMEMYGSKKVDLGKFDKKDGAGGKGKKNGKGKGEGL
jgi:hypothetical protein